jgi:hypothetical protein
MTFAPDSWTMIVTEEAARRRLAFSRRLAKQVHLAAMFLMIGLVLVNMERQGRNLIVQQARETTRPDGVGN